MKIDLERAGKQVNRLRKLFKRLPPDPSPENVHELRTQARKIEALLHAFPPAGRAGSRRLLKLMKPVRKAAGRVRDMDVLVAKASTLSVRAPSDGIIRLVEHTSEIRAGDARRLHRLVRRRRKEARDLLRGFLRDLQRIQKDSSTVPVSPARAQTLAQELDHWPGLDKRNLHEFRKGLKELRYMLQLVPDHDARQINSFAKVKDTAGEWHDWLQLSRVAESVLAPEDDAALLGAIRKTLQEKLRGALTAANALRKHGIDVRFVA